MACFNFSMSHKRTREVSNILNKKLKFSPVVTIQGARQTGKSFLVRELLKKELPKIEYTSFDEKAARNFASTNPQTFLAQNAHAHPFAIDEAQKVPDIFDAVKFSVDQDRRPGRFLLLGSTEFSKMLLIRESLTGRMSRVRIFPMSLSETLEIPPNKTAFLEPFHRNARIKNVDLLKYLRFGGMPGIFSVRGQGERESLMKDWLDLTVQRDLSLIPKLKFNSELAYTILEQIAILPEPTAGAIAKSCKKDLRVIHSYLQALSTLFVINKLNPSTLGTGKPIYFLLDVAFASFFGASFERQLHTVLLNELLCRISYRGELHSELSYYRTPKGSWVHLLIKQKNDYSAIKIFSEENVKKPELLILSALRNKLPKVKLLGYGPMYQHYKDKQITLFAWESIA